MAPRDRVAVIIYVSPAIKAELERRAKEQDRSISYVGWKLLEDAVSDYSG